MKVLLVHPGATHSTADVEAGLRCGLEAHGVEVVRYRLDARIERSRAWLYGAWRHARKRQADLARPTMHDVFYDAGVGVLERALRFQVDAVVVVSAMFLHPDVLILLRRAHVPTTILLTETPYDLDQELKVAALVDGVWTAERTALPAFRAVNPRSAYLPHAWHPERHGPGPQPGDDQVAAHDVVFVGSAFPERIAWFAAIDWTGIDLGLYGNWQLLPATHPLRAHVRGDFTDNVQTAALYRRARVGLNLYRTSGSGPDAPHVARADSLNPRAYELAACGAFHLSTPRAEVTEVFGDAVPTVETPAAAAVALRRWLADPQGRAAAAARLRACVAHASWIDRAGQLLGDLTTVARAA